MRKLTLLIPLIPLLVAPLTALSQTYPAKPINFIVQYGAGAGADQLARVVSEAVNRNTGATFVIKNMPGALGVIGTSALLRSPADGYTIGICSSSINSIATSVMKSVPYDTVSDFTFIEPLAGYTYVLVSAPGVGMDTLDGLLKQAAAKPNALSYAYANATAQVLAAALTKELELKAVSVPYKTAQESLTDISQNRVAFGITDMGVTAPMVRGGRVKALAVISSQRSATLPDVPTLAELGKPSIDVIAWAGVCAPKNMPPDVTAWLRAQIRKAVAEPAMAEKLKLLGLEPLNLGTRSFTEFVVGQNKFWSTSAQDAGIKPE